MTEAKSAPSARMAARSMTAPPEEWGRDSRVTSARIASSFMLHTVLFARNQDSPTMSNRRAIRLAVGVRWSSRLIPAPRSGAAARWTETTVERPLDKAVPSDSAVVASSTLRARSLAEGAKGSYDAEQGPKGPASNVQTLYATNCYLQASSGKKKPTLAL
jgi:hypothetical protein